MGGTKKDPGVLLRLPQELYERIVAWSSETGRSINELLLDAVQRSFLAWPDGLEKQESLQQENQRLQQRVQELLEELRALHPEYKPSPVKIAPRRVPPEEQKRAFQEAQKRLEALRTQRTSQRQPVQLPGPKPAELARLKEIEAQMFQVATELVSPQSELLNQRREQARRGRLEGVAYEESDNFPKKRQRDEEKVTRPPHVNAELQKKTAELSARQSKNKNR
jgi:hypothetical protein